MIDAAIHPLSIAGRMTRYGLATFREVRELEQREPWITEWSATYQAGEQNLREWLASGRPPANRAALSVVGDRSIVRAVRSVVAALPEAVAHFLVGRVVIVSSGVESRGFCGSMPRPPCDAPYLVALAVDDHGVIAHELAHAWHRQTLPSDWLLTAEELVQLRAVLIEDAVDKGDIAEWTEAILRGERAADALATAWGFPIDSTSGARGDYRRRRLHEKFEGAFEEPEPHDDTRPLGQAFGAGR